MPGRSKRKGEPQEDQTGRPPLLTPKLHKQIIDAVELLGMLESRAAMAYGISEATISRWKKRGIIALKAWDTLTPEQKAVESRYAEFFKALRNAEPKFEMANLTVIQNAAVNGDWRAAKERLAIKMPQIYGKRVMLGGDPQNPTPIPTMGARVQIYLPENGRNPGLAKPEEPPA